MQATQVHLIGMKIRWPQPFAGNPTFGDELKISARWIDLDGFLLDELVFKIGLPQVADGLFAC